MKIKNIKFIVGLIITVGLSVTILSNKSLADTNTDSNNVTNYSESYSERSDERFVEDNFGYEYDDYYYEERNNSVIAFAFIFLLLLFGLGAIGIYFIYRNKNSNNNSNESYVRHDEERGYATDTPEMNEEEVQRRISRIDPEFSGEEFLAWAKDLYIKLQYAWSDKELDIMRCLETPQLFEHHRSQIERYTQNGQADKIERLCVNWAKLFNFKQEGSRDVLSILINSKMIDYLVEEKTGKVLNGSKTELKTNTYKLTFVRTTGVKTTPGTTTVNTTNCPNCGASVDITTAGKCAYCGSTITTGNFNWVLSNLEPYKASSGDTDYGENSGGFGLGFFSGMVATGLLGGLARGMFSPPPPRHGGPHGGMGGFGGPHGGPGGRR